MNRVRSMLLGGFLAGSAALAGCATIEEEVVENTSETYRATLTGAQEPHGGDPDGTASAQLSVSDRLDQICYDVNDIRNIGTITAAHIHRGAAGTEGPPVLPLDVANEGGFKGCTSAPEWLQDAIENRFAGYYVNIHTTDYPRGAIRGQFGN